MVFNMGLPRMRLFKAMRQCVNDRDWAGAALEMLDSKWARQLPNRSERLVKRMRALADG